MARNDFNGDGRSDILFRDTDGVIVDFLSAPDGGFVSNIENSFVRVDSGWQVAGVGDFNGDGRSDILWRNDGGAIFNFLGSSNGGFTNNGDNSYVQVQPSWHVAAVGDFNGDGRGDILWRNDSGAIFNFLGTANGGFVNNGDRSSVQVDSSWHIDGTGDFNGDGCDDIMWVRSGGYASEWLGQADGGFVPNQAYDMDQVSSGIAAVDDFNGDGRDDVVTMDGWGLLSAYAAEPDGSFNFNAYEPIAGGLSERLVATGDYNGDGRSDVLLQGDELIELLAQPGGGFAANPSVEGFVVPAAWHVEPHSFWYY